jgi:hypothetical protein
MNKFIICANQYLRHNTQGYYSDEYHGGGNWKIDGTIENIITTLKNDITPYDNKILQLAVSRLKIILKDNLPEISRAVNSRNITVCVVPRAKVNYAQNQLLFKNTVKEVVTNLNGFIDGVDFITRQKNTKTTHRNKAGYGGDGDMPYPGITKKTCKISNNVLGKDILLIDDVYTGSINIDEDAIQALYDNGANSVIFYAIGKTV